MLFRSCGNPLLSSFTALCHNGNKDKQQPDITKYGNLFFSIDMGPHSNEEISRNNAIWKVGLILNKRFGYRYEDDDINYHKSTYCHSSKYLDQLLPGARDKMRHFNFAYMRHFNEQRTEFIQSFDSKRRYIKKDWEESIQQLSTNPEINCYMLFINERSEEECIEYFYDETYYAEMSWSIYLCGINLNDPSIVYVYGPRSIYYNDYNLDKYSI